MLFCRIVGDWAVGRQRCWAACRCLLARAGGFCGPEGHREQLGSSGRCFLLPTKSKEVPAFSAPAPVEGPPVRRWSKTLLGLGPRAEWGHLASVSGAQVTRGWGR